MENKTKKIIAIILAAIIAFLIAITFATKKNESHSPEILPETEKTSAETPMELNENSITTEENKKEADDKQSLTTVKKSTVKKSVKQSKTQYTKELPASKSSISKDITNSADNEADILKSEPASKLVEVDKEINPNNSEIVKFRGVTYKIKIKPQSKEGINDNQAELN